MKERRSIDQAIADYLPLGYQILDWMNEHPEPSGNEKKTVAFLVKTLKENGYQVTSPIKRIKHSFWARRATDQNQNKPKVAILCEYDAIEEQGHSLGHSASCAASIVCALALEAAYEDFPFQVELIGTPNEEVGGAKIAMLAKGMFDSYAFAILTQMGPHNYPCFKTVAASDLYVHYYGKSAHVSINPWEGINALNGVQLFFHALDMLRPQLEPGCQISGIITEGGKIPNAIPEQASAYVYLRANRYQQILKLKERVENCARGCAIATENQFMNEQLNPTYAEIVPNAVMEQMVFDIMTQLGLTPDKQHVLTYSTDVGNVSLSIPVFCPMISIGKADALYSQEFAQDMKVEGGRFGMKNAILVMVHILVTLADHPKQLQKIQDEHEAYVNRK